jgi:prepilin peptidase CpaA
MTALSLLPLGVLPALVIVAGLTDLTSMKIPNWISAVLIVAFFPAAFIAGLPGQDILIHVGVGVAALFVGMAMFALRWIGGGDAKLLASVCLWMGLGGTAPFLLYTAVVGGGFGLLLLLARSYAQPYVRGAPGWVATLMEPKGDIPYGVAIAAGALLAFPASPLVVSALS